MFVPVTQRLPDEVLSKRPIFQPHNTRAEVRVGERIKVCQINSVIVVNESYAEGQC